MKSSEHGWGHVWIGWVVVSCEGPMPAFGLFLFGGQSGSVVSMAVTSLALALALPPLSFNRRGGSRVPYVLVVYLLFLCCVLRLDF
ncbi:hypothetical protein TIFTF001_002969 [Ficus carica]|uniref:Uncharacterized protein n=1 Tax=Ficus carica TaxID=3494 RepID=A0AA87ZAG0_FICCA|nr:hypothetical protein TIFTF001_002969 [Ficus carica]